MSPAPSSPSKTNKKTLSFHSIKSAETLDIPESLDEFLELSDSSNEFEKPKKKGVPPTNAATTVVSAIQEENEGDENSYAKLTVREKIDALRQKREARLGIHTPHGSGHLSTTASKEFTAEPIAPPIGGGKSPLTAVVKSVLAYQPTFQKAAGTLISVPATSPPPQPIPLLSFLDEEDSVSALKSSEIKTDIETAPTSEVDSSFVLIKDESEEVKTDINIATEIDLDYYEDDFNQTFDDKERFFRDLESDAPEPVDYGELLKKLDEQEQLHQSGLEEQLTENISKIEIEHLLEESENEIRDVKSLSEPTSTSSIHTGSGLTSFIKTGKEISSPPLKSQPGPSAISDLVGQTSIDAVDLPSQLLSLLPDSGIISHTNSALSAHPIEVLTKPAPSISATKEDKAISRFPTEISADVSDTSIPSDSILNDIREKILSKPSNNQNPTIAKPTSTSATISIKPVRPPSPAAKDQVSLNSFDFSNYQPPVAVDPSVNLTGLLAPFADELASGVVSSAKEDVNPISTKNILDHLEDLSLKPVPRAKTSETHRIPNFVVSKPASSPSKVNGSRPASTTPLKRASSSTKHVTLVKSVASDNDLDIFMDTSQSSPVHKVKSKPSRSDNLSSTSTISTSTEKEIEEIRNLKVTVAGQKLEIQSLKEIVRENETFLSKARKDLDRAERASKAGGAEAMQEQELLIRGYQHENEKLVESNKELRKMAKEAERQSQAVQEGLIREITALKNQADERQRIPDAKLRKQLEDTTAAYDERIASLIAVQEALQHEVGTLKMELITTTVARSGSPVLVENDVESQGQRAVKDERLPENKSDLLRKESELRIEQCVSFIEKQSKSLAALFEVIKGFIETSLSKKGLSSAVIKAIKKSRVAAEELMKQSAREREAWESNMSSWNSVQVNSSASLDSHKAEFEALKNRVLEVEGKLLSALNKSDGLSQEQLQEIVAQVVDLNGSHSAIDSQPVPAKVSKVLLTDSSTLSSTALIATDPKVSSLQASKITELEKINADLVFQLREYQLSAAAAEAIHQKELKEVSESVAELETRMFKPNSKEVLSVDDAAALREKIAAQSLEIDALKNRLEISEGTRQAVHETTMTILKQTQEEKSKFSLIQQEQSLRTLLNDLRQESKLAERLAADRIRELEESVERLRTTKDTLIEEHERAISTCREELFASKNELERLEKVVHVSQEAWPPSMKHFEALSLRIRELEHSARKREVEVAKLLEEERKQLGLIDSELTGAHKHSHLNTVPLQHHNFELEAQKRHFVHLIQQKDSEILVFKREMDQVINGMIELRSAILL